LRSTRRRLTAIPETCSQTRMLIHRRQRNPHLRPDLKRVHIRTTELKGVKCSAVDSQSMTAGPRRFPPPWTFEETNNARFIVKDANGFAVYRYAPHRLSGDQSFFG
jgi:hypothetical protein